MQKISSTIFTWYVSLAKMNVDDRDIKCNVNHYTTIVLASLFPECVVMYDLTLYVYSGLYQELNF